MLPALVLLVYLSLYSNPKFILKIDCSIFIIILSCLLKHLHYYLHYFYYRCFHQQPKAKTRIRYVRTLQHLLLLGVNLLLYVLALSNLYFY